MTERKSYSIPLSPELLTECLLLVQQKPQYLLIPLCCFSALAFGLIGLLLLNLSNEQKLTRLQLESLRLRVVSIGNVIPPSQNKETLGRLDRLETEQNQYIQKLDLIQQMQMGLSEKYQTLLLSPETMISMDQDNHEVK